MLEFGVDEITLVLQLSPIIKGQIVLSDWCDIAEDMIYRFVDKSGFKTIYGDVILEERPPSGYTIAYTYGEHNFYLAVAYHQFQVRMGVVIKFSAQALDYYCEASGLKVYEFIQLIKDNYYTIRLSRIDLTADYIDEDINVTTIYQNFIDNKVGVFREHISEKTGELSYRRCDMQYQGFINGQEVPTIYLGSVKSNSRLRIYDKKREQMERKGSKLEKAKKCHDWTRVEGVFRHEFAHQISDRLLKISTDDEFANLIACTIIQKFRLMYIDSGVIDCDTEYSQMLLDSITNQNFALKSPSSRNYDIAKSLAYLFSGSGVISTLYKIKAIWGADAISELLLFIEEYLDEWIQNDDCRYWLRKNTADYRKNYPDFDMVLKNNIMPML